MTEFRPDPKVQRRLIAAFDQGRHLEEHEEGVCLALCLYWLKRYRKLQWDESADGEESDSPLDPVMVRRHHTALADRLNRKFYKSYRIQTELEREAERWRKRERALAAQERFDEAVQRRLDQGKDLSDRHYRVLDWLERHAERTGTAVANSPLQSSRDYSHGLAAQYGLKYLPGGPLGRMTVGTGKRIVEYLESQGSRMITIGIFNDESGHCIAAYRATTNRNAGFALFDPNTGMYQFPPAARKGGACLDDYLACYVENGTRAYHEWSVDALAPA